MTADGIITKSKITAFLPFWKKQLLFVGKLVPWLFSDATYFLLLIGYALKRFLLK